MKTKILIVILFLATVSCDEFLEEAPRSTYSSSNFYNSEEGLNAGIAGVYDNLRSFYSYEGSAALFLGTDVACTKWQSGFRIDFDSYSWGTEGYYFNWIWNDHYRLIMRANALIIDAPNSGVDEDIINRIVGEAKFLRALSYFRLVQLWGPVPLLLGGETDEMPRETVGKIYEQIISDLNDATQAGILPIEKKVSEEGRVTHYAAKTLLGKVYLTMASYIKYGVVFEGLMQQAGKSDYGYKASIAEDANSLYQKAESVLKDVIDNSGYALLDKYEDVFDIDNKNLNSESIFEVQFSEDVAGAWSKDLGHANWEPSYSHLGSWIGSTNCRAVPSLWGFYDEGDQRREWNFPPYLILKSGQNYQQYADINDPDVWGGTARHDRLMNGTGNFFAFAGFAKYRWGDTWDGWHGYAGGENVPTNGIMLRYADVLLMYAEASLEINGQNTNSLNAINEVRNRARGAGISPSETPEFQNLTLSELTLDEIFDERARELCIEHHRKFDLLRTNKLQEANLTRKPTNEYYMTGPMQISDHRWLFPIPQTEVDVVIDKGMLWQNPGY